MNKFLYGTDQSVTTLHDNCSLSLGCKECGKRGYILEDTGFNISARLCSCVTNCPNCRGACRSVKDGAVRQCLNIDKQDPKKIVNIFNSAGLPARFFNADLTSFSNNTGNCKKIVAMVKDWILSYLQGEQSKGFVLSGDVGVGKTYILVATAKKLASYGADVKFVDFHELLNLIRSGYSENKSEESFLKPLISAQVLFIDELAKGRNNDWEQEKLDQLIMRRYNANKISVYSTNYSLKEESRTSDLTDEYSYDDSKFNPGVFGSLEKRIGTRIFSRLVETSIFMEINGKDYRKILARGS